MRISAFLAAVVIAAACSGTEHAHDAVVSVGGRVGPLRIDRSKRSDVVRFAGRPQAERRAREPGSAPYDALGYSCSEHERPTSFPLVAGRAPSCGTVFWLDARSGRLEDFYTTSRRYSEAHGVRIGMRSRRAERRLRRRLYLGCEEDIHLASAKALLTVAFTGGRPHRDRAGGLRVHRARVYALVLHSRLRDAGVFDCL